MFQLVRFGLAGLGLLFIFVIASFAYMWMVGWYYSEKNYGQLELATQGTPRVAVAGQMEELFGTSRPTIGIGGRDKLFWNSRLILYGRYDLMMYVPVIIHSATNAVVTGNPEFQLNEITEVTTNFDVGVSYAGGHWKFGHKEWDQLYQAKGDFSAIGIVLGTNEPVKNVEAFIKAVMR